MTHLRATFALLTVLAAGVAASGQTPAKPKISASAIQIAMVETGDVQIPAEFRFAMYERIVERMRESGGFQKVYRAGDQAANGASDLVILHTKVENFNAGSETVRGLTTVLGATTVHITASVTGHDGGELMTQKITGRVRFFGENLGVANDLAKRITKSVRETSAGGHS
jgi:hypothetical protein